MVQLSKALPKSSLIKLGKNNHLWVNWHLQNATKKNRKHPDTKDGGMVRYKLNPNIGTKKSSAEMEFNTA